MKDPLRILERNKSYGYLILRMIVGMIFLVHGYGKLWGNAPGIEAWIGMIGSLGFPLTTFTAYLVGYAEFLGGLALILGLLTRYASILLSIVMIVAIFKVKLSLGLIGGYELDLALLAANISLIFTGAGKISLDKLIFRKEIIR